MDASETIVQRRNIGVDHGFSDPHVAFLR